MAEQSAGVALYLEQVERAKGANQNISTGTRTKVETRTSAAKAAGLSKSQKDAAHCVAKVPEDQFEKMVEADNPAAITDLAEAGTQKQPPKNAVDLNP